MMFYIEVLFVGLYCIFIYLYVTMFINIQNKTLLLFIIGFIKHLFGYILNFQQYYCNCIYFNQQYFTLFLECILEGFLFILLGNCLSFIIKNNFLLFFVIGIILHVLFEVIGFHSLFCKIKCRPVNI